tara:strand:- start:227 stop:1111 length:885 start_codon:yes stop_codon:yes gene_type:complete
MTKIKSPKKGTWISAHDISHKELRILVELGFDEDLLEDAIDYFEVPRFEYVNEVNYLFTRYPIISEDGELSTAPLLIALSDTIVLTVSPRKVEFLDDFAHNRAPFITTQKNKAMLVILETIVQHYHRSIMTIRRTMLKYFSNIGNISEADMKGFVGLESMVTDYMSALDPTKEALDYMILRNKKITLHEEDVEIMEDLSLDIKQMIESGKSVSKNIQTIRSAHESILAHKLNITMKTLTAVTIVLTIPTIITSLFGMNTWLPFSEGPLSFLAILTLTAVIAFFVVWLFKRNQWI